MTEALVLIVDDETDLLQLYGGIIRRLGYDVREAPGGAEAIEILEQFTPDLMILDMAMPRVSGREVLDFIKAHSHLDDMHIIVLTALGGPGTAQVSGAMDRIARWINKPVRPSLFQDIIREMIEGAE